MRRLLTTLALALLAATTAVAWHSHVHAAMILIPPILMFAVGRPAADAGILAKWVLIPAGALIGRSALAALSLDV